MNWFQRLMAGRYGADHLCFALFLLSLVIMIITNITGILALSLLSYVPLGYGFFRMMSRNIYKRRSENEKFMRIVRKIPARWRKFKANRQDAKIHKYYLCPGCKTKLRLPKGKGKIKITCPKCHTQFIGKT